jgi:hypothetical protein
VRPIPPPTLASNPDNDGPPIGAQVSEAFGKIIVVENLPGAGRRVAAKMVLPVQPAWACLAPSDSGALAIDIAPNPELGYDPLKNFTLISVKRNMPCPTINHGHAAISAGIPSTLQASILAGLERCKVPVPRLTSITRMARSTIRGIVPAA